MPKLYEYLGIIVLFYSNEHEPVHVHGKYQNKETRAEFTIEDGKVTSIAYVAVRGKRPLDGAESKNFQTLIEHHADEIVQKWIDYFVLHKPIEPQIITRRIK